MQNTLNDWNATILKFNNPKPGSPTNSDYYVFEITNLISNSTGDMLYECYLMGINFYDYVSIKNMIFSDGLDWVTAFL